MLSDLFDKCSFVECQAILHTHANPCKWCGRPLCETHRAAAFHACTKLDYSQRMLARKWAKIEAIAAAAPDIEYAALQFRPDVESVKLIIPESADEVRSGEFNVHVPIEFSDGISWLIRFKKNGYAGRTRALRRMYLKSEYCTIKVLRTLAPQWIPDAWLPLATAGLDYTFVEKVVGVVYDNREACPNAATMKDLALFFHKTTAVSFRGIGSLCAEGDISDVEGDPVNGVTVGPMLWPLMDTAEPAGPFRTSQEAHLARLDYKLKQIEEGRSGDRWPYDAYLQLLDIRELVAQDEEMACEVPTFLAHQDAKGDQFMTNPDGSGLSAVIDWEYTATVPMAEFFAADSTFLTEQIYYEFWAKGDNTLSEYELSLRDELVALGRTDLADALQHSRKYQRLREIMRGNTTLPELWGFRQACLGDKAGPKPKNMHEWEQMAAKRHAADPVLARMRQRQYPNEGAEEDQTEQGEAE